MKIRNKITLPFFITIIIILTAGLFGLYYYSVLNVYNSIHDQLTAANLARAKHVTTYLDILSGRLTDFASDGKIKDCLYYIQNQSPDCTSDNLSRHLIDNKLPADTNIYEVFTLNNNGQVVATSNSNEETGTDFSTSDFFIQGKQHYYYGNIIQDEEFDQVGQIVSIPVIRNQEPVGVLVARINIDPLYDILTDHTGWKLTGETYLLNKHNQMLSPSRFQPNETTLLNQVVDTENARLCHQLREKIAQQPTSSTQNHTGPDPEGSFSDYRGVSVIGSYVYIEPTDWCLLAEFDEAETSAPARIILWVLLGGGLSTIAIFLTLSTIISRTISRPLEQLQHQATSLAKGNLDIKVGTKSSDEIGQLSRDLDRMTTAIKKSRSEIDRQVATQTKKISESKQDLEKQQTATLNIMEDLEDNKKDMEDQQQAILNILEDIDNEKNIVSREKNKISAILQSIGDGVLVVDEKMHITMFNEAATIISGFATQEAIGQRYDNILKFVTTKDQHETPDTFIQQAIKTGKTQQMSTRTTLTSKQGKIIPVADSAAPLLDGRGKIVGVVVVFRDVTKEREIDQAKTEFVSLASHQLRTPLSTINWYTEMLLAEDAGRIEPEQKEYLQQIYNGNQRMVNLVNALLNVSRLELGTFSIDPKPTDIFKIADSVLKELEPQIKAKPLKTKAHYNDQLPRDLLLDPQLIRIILQNLLSNAVKYTPPKGHISLKIDQIDNNLLIQVSDTGYGIPRKQQPRIFQKLFRADNVVEKDTQGTGLGLYIIKSIVETVKGKVWFESVENEGTTFNVSMPIAGMQPKHGSKQLG